MAQLNRSAATRELDAAVENCAAIERVRTEARGLAARLRGLAARLEHEAGEHLLEAASELEGWCDGEVGIALQAASDIVRRWTAKLAA